MSYSAMDYVLAHSRSKGSTKVVLLTLASHANAAGESWPSIGRLAAYAGGLTDRAVRNALRDLEEAGEVVTVQQRGEARQGNLRPNLYRLVMPACPCPRNAAGYIQHVEPPRRPSTLGTGE